jgi:hypothetical protein
VSQHKKARKPGRIPRHAIAKLNLAVRQHSYLASSLGSSNTKNLEIRAVMQQVSEFFMESKNAPNVKPSTAVRYLTPMLPEGTEARGRSRKEKPLR